MTGALACGCAASLTDLQPAKTVPAHHLDVTVSVQGTPPSGLPGRTLDDVERADAVTDPLSDAEIRQLAEAASGVVVAPPSVDALFALTYGVTDRFELRARAGLTNFGGTARVLFLRTAVGVYGSIGVTGLFGFASFPIERYTDRVHARRERRNEIALPLLFGYSSAHAHAHVWAGPKLAFTHFDSRFDVCLDVLCSRKGKGRVSGWARYYGGQIGAAVGGPRVWFALEMSLSRVHPTTTARVTQTGDAPIMVRYERKGRVFVPALGIITGF